MLLDAYTIRKAIPRIVVAVIGINLSIYLCVAMIDATNVIGGGMAQLLTAPFNTAELDEFNIDSGLTASTASNAIIGGVGTIVGIKALSVLLGVFFGSLGAGGGAAAGGAISTATAGLAALFFLIILPLFLLVLGILAVVIIRQALLLFLTIVSPVAIALWVLPGTEKYFKRWFDLFIKALMVYPIIAVIFAMSDILGSIIFSNTNDGALTIPRIIVGLAVIYAPLFLIPFAFRLAGGAIAGLAKAVSGVGDRVGQSGIIKGRQEHYGQQFKDTQTRARVQAYKRSQAREDRSTGLRKRMNRLGTRALGGYRGDTFLKESELNKRTIERLNDATNFGPDNLERAYTVDKEGAMRNWENAPRTRTRDQNGNVTETSQDGRMRRIYNSDGSLRTTEFQSAGGSWQSESAVDESQRVFGKNNMSQYQASMSYEMKKANTQEQQDNLVRSFASQMDSWGASEDEANSAWIGAGFANQDKNRQWKHGRWSNSGGSFAMSSGGQNLISEYDEAVGPYAGGNSNADTWVGMGEQVRESAGVITSSQTAIDDIHRTAGGAPLTQRQQEEVDHHQATIDSHRDTLRKSARIVNSIRSRQVPRDGDGNPIPGAAPVEVIGSGAVPHTQEAMRNFAAIADHYAGVYEEPEVTLPSMGGSRPDIPRGTVEDGMDARSRDGRR